MNLIRRYLSLLTALRSKIIAPKDDVRVRVDAVVRVGSVGEKNKKG